MSVYLYVSLSFTVEHLNQFQPNSLCYKTSRGGGRNGIYVKIMKTTDISVQSIVIGVAETNR